MPYAPMMLALFVSLACGGAHPDAGDPVADRTCARTDVREGGGVVNTESGPLRGVEGDGITVFKGIPYASPPVDSRRWRPPEPPVCWDGIRSATMFGSICMQPGVAADPESEPIGSEDCLTLNVWTPDPRRGAHLPVLVFVHGGYFTWGSSSARINGVEVYDGARLASEGRAVVVTINYRLGVLGFIGHPALTKESPHHASGNYGLLDQVAALSWVQRNIEGFGGDPTRVTLFGQSAGAISTASLYASPLARGLFAGAIMHSGSGAAHPLSESEQAGVELARNVACDDQRDVLGCLRARSPAQLVTGLPESFGGGYGFGPTIDGWVLPEQPLDLVREGRGNHVPLVVGVTADEYTTMIRNHIDRPIDNEANYAAFLRGRLGAGRATAILERYPADGYASPSAALVAFFGDVSFVCPSRQFTRAAALHAPVRRFVYRHVFENGPLAHLRAAHGFDLMMVFGNFVDVVPTASERQLSDGMRAAWARFAATGDPGDAHELQWPVYDPQADTYLELDVPPQIAQGFRRSECDYWDAKLAPSQSTTQRTREE